MENQKKNRKCHVLSLPPGSNLQVSLPSPSMKAKAGSDGMEPLAKADCTTGISSWEVIANVDLLLLILLCLPPRSLIRFKCVCKKWLSLISDTKFHYDHTHHNLHLSTSGLYYAGLRNLLQTCVPLSLLEGIHCSLPPLSFVKQTGMHSLIHHSHNGLILCSTITRTTCKPQFLICNPTTQRYKLLPLLDGLHLVQHLLCFLCFDPSISTHFKVILFKHRFWENIYEFFIYSSESQSWKTIRHLGKFNVTFTHGLVSSGTVVNLMGYSNRDIHVLFKFDTEMFSSSRWIEEPRISSPYKIGYFGEHGGKLLLIVYCAGGELRSYEMDEKEGSHCHWIMKLHLDLEQVFSVPSADQPYFCEGQWYSGFAVIWASFQDGDLELVFAVQNKFIFYNPRTKVKKLLDIPPCPYRNSIKCDENLKVYPFIESLFPI